jgi:arylformamidase
MNAIDYEAEYNNRARVPEHPSIIEGWARDAEAYRGEVGRRLIQIPYGPTERQEIDLFTPEEPQGGATVMFIHGGYWQGLHRTYFSHLARGLNARGITVAIPSYDLCPQVRIGEIVDEMRQACRALRDRGRLVVAGHSAGGHLAACLLATDWASLGLSPHLVERAYAISGLFDLKPLIATSINKALDLSEREAERLSPLLWVPPAGRVLDAVVGAEESAEYLRQSRSLADLWGMAGVTTRYEAVPGANHFTVIAPLADPDSSMTRRLAELARI